MAGTGHKFLPRWPQGEIFGGVTDWPAMERALLKTRTARATVYIVVKSAGPSGMLPHQVAHDLPGLAYTGVTARLAELACPDRYTVLGAGLLVTVGSGSPKRYVARLCLKED